MIGFFFVVIIIAFLNSLSNARNTIAQTPPMGWMSWELFRCNIDCSDKTKCISEWMYKDQADVLHAEGYKEAGYLGVHMDDCWEANTRDPNTNELYANTTRFPSGLAELGKYIHNKGLKFGLYTDEGAYTCGGYQGSQHNEELDAQTFAKWGVDYIKVDGCTSNLTYLKEGYKKMGQALELSGRDIEYSCSYPAYMTTTEDKKPFYEFIMDGCNEWRNWWDIECKWDSLSSIIDYFGNASHILAPFAGPGHWHDPDMLIIGGNCITNIEEETQMAIWSIMAAPLIMGNDLRKVTTDSKEILLNKAAIAVNQDPLGQMGVRIVNKDNNYDTQIWYRNLFNGDIAVAFYNKNAGDTVDITVNFSQMNFNGTVTAHDIFLGQGAGKFYQSMTAKDVPLHGVKFYKLSLVDKHQQQQQQVPIIKQE